MKGFRINPDRKYVNVIMEGLEKKNGHCPCRVNVDDTTLCPCDEFINDGICKCKLYVKIDSENSDDDNSIVSDDKDK